MSLVRAAWERRPEGPAYLLSICDAPISRRPVCFRLHTLPPLGQWNSEDFPRVPADGFFLQFLNFEILDLSLLAKPAGLSGGICVIFEA